MFQGLFHSLNSGKLNFQIFIKDLPRDKLTACSTLLTCAKDCNIRWLKWRFANFSYYDVVSEYPSVKIKKSSLDLTLSTLNLTGTMLENYKINSTSEGVANRGYIYYL